MAGLAAIASVAGMAISAVGSIATGQSQMQAAQYQAAEYDREAKAETATAQANALEYGRQTKLVLARLQNNAASSGFSATDAGTLGLGYNITKRGIYDASVAQYGGADRAAGLQAAGQSALATGRARQTAGYFGAAGTLLSGGVSLYDKYASGLYNPQNSFTVPGWG